MFKNIFRKVRNAWTDIVDFENEDNENNEN